MPTPTFLSIPTMSLVCADMTVGDALAVNVKDAAFGALGDGLTDDTAAIQAAIDSFLTTRTVHDYGAGGTGAAGPVAKGCVLLPPGTYIVKNVVLRSGI